MVFELGFRSEWYLVGLIAPSKLHVIKRNFDYALGRSPFKYVAECSPMFAQ